MRKTVTQQIHSRSKKASRKEKSLILDEFIKTTGYNRKYALRVLNKPDTTEALLFVKGKALKLKPSKKKPTNRKGKNLYRQSHRFSASHLGVLWVHMREIFHSPHAAANVLHRSWTAANFRFDSITLVIRDELMNISPAPIDRYLKKDKAALAFKGKSLTKSVDSLKYRIPIKTFYLSEKRTLPGFIQIDTVHHCSQFTSGQ